jgi:hypothetical protein
MLDRARNIRHTCDPALLLFFHRLPWAPLTLEYGRGQAAVDGADK